jgi:hypothetical protein
MKDGRSEGVVLEKKKDNQGKKNEIKKKADRVFGVAFIVGEKGKRS